MYSAQLKIECFSKIYLNTNSNFNLKYSGNSVIYTPKALPSETTMPGARFCKESSKMSLPGAVPVCGYDDDDFEEEFFQLY